MKLSIIIPVYDSEKYLKQCLESVLGQDLDSSEYEVIVINDGSTDMSRNIILDFQNKNSNMVFIDQENQGVSAARNAGIDLAKGEYITFVDSDDLLFPNALKNSWHYAKENSLDLLYTRMHYIDVAGNITGEFKMDSDKVEILDGYHHQRRGYIVGLYRKKSLADLRFNTKVPVSEDALFNLLFHAKLSRISYFPGPFYKYRHTPTSALNSDISKSEKAFEGYLTIIATIHEYIDTHKNSLTPEQIAYFNRPYFITVRMAVESNIIPLRSKENFMRLKRLLEKLDLKNTELAIAKEFRFFRNTWSLFILHVSLLNIKNALKWKLFRSQ